MRGTPQASCGSRTGTPPTETVLDTRFTPEWLEDHPNDAALVRILAQRRDEPKADAVRRGGIGELDDLVTALRDT